MRKQVTLLLLSAALMPACASRNDAPAAPAPDLELQHGRVLKLPIEGSFPRLGLRWTYVVKVEGGELRVPPRLAYQLTGRDAAGHPWAGWWMYQGIEEAEWTGATITPGYVFFHPPRLGVFRQLQWAPWPTAKPDEPGRASIELVFGQGWGEHEGKRIRKMLTNVGYRSVSVPAGEFERAWYVEGTSEGWTGEFFWVERVGFVRMVFAKTGQFRIVLDLEDARLVDGATED